MTGLTSVSVTVRTGDAFFHLELFGCAVGNFREVQSDFHSHVCAFELSRSAGASSASAKASETKLGEDVAEVSEDVVEVHSSGVEASSEACSVQPLRSELVVAGTFVRVAQHIVGFGCEFEFLFSLFVSGIAVGALFDGDFFIGTFNLLGGCVSLHSQDFVIVFLLCHILSILYTLYIIYTINAYSKKTNLE